MENKAQDLLRYHWYANANLWTSFRRPNVRIMVSFLPPKHFIEIRGRRLVFFIAPQNKLVFRALPRLTGKSRTYLPSFRRYRSGCLAWFTKRATVVIFGLIIFMLVFRAKYHKGANREHGEIIVPAAEMKCSIFGLWLPRSGIDRSSGRFRRFVKKISAVVFLGGFAFQRFLVVSTRLVG